ncbi:MAG: hypothetical protein OXI26_05225 [bacterium]|nr:hypothetical protein [bacterium]
MSVVSIETPDVLLRRIYDEEFGFLPTNKSMKPVHVANGLARRVVGATNDFRPLAKVIRQYVTKQKAGYLEERNPNAAIIEAYPDKFQDLHRNPPPDERLTSFRALAKDTLGADGAVFESGQSSFTLSHQRMITNDVSDNGSGDFLAGLLTAGSGPVVATDLLRDLLDRDTDPWTMIAWPMLGVGATSDAELSGVARTRAERVSADLLAVGKDGQISSPTLRELRRRFDQLASHEKQGEKLTTLRRLVLFGCFAIHVHMIHRCADVMRDGPRPPILLDMCDGRRRSLREASAATLEAGRRAIEQLVVFRIREHLASVLGEEERIELYLDALPDTPDKQLIVDVYRAERASVGAVDALVEAYWKAGYSGVGPKAAKGYPWNALRELGRRSGYLSPYDDRGRGGKEHKRYGVNAEFAEVLVASVVAPGHPRQFDEFLDDLRDAYGIVVGRQGDFDIVRRNDLRLGADLPRSVSFNENDLRLNVNQFRDLLVDIGFAKTYADGRTIVTTDEGRQL